jgi:hypothetical protein
MVNLNSVWAVIYVVVLAAAAVPAGADPATTSPPTAQDASALQVSLECERLTPDQARDVARQAQRDGSHHKAAQCFRAAGDLARADHALVLASAETSASASRKVAMNLEAAKLQARRVREAFR